MKLENKIIDYGYDKTLHPDWIFYPKHIKMHCYWSGIFGLKQLFSIKSIIGTQKCYDYDITIWIDKDTKIDDSISEELLNITQNTKCIEIQQFDIEQHIKNTPFKENKFNYITLPNISDIIRFIILYEYGGLWFDLDTFFIRDIHNFFINDFVYAWEFQPYANSAIFYIQDKQSQKMERLMNKCIKCRCRPWEIFRYDNEEIKELTVYPCYIFDPLWGYGKNSIVKKPSDFFTKDIGIYSIYDFFPNSYIYHWHNCWDVEINPDSTFEIFNKLLNNEISNKGIK